MISLESTSITMPPLALFGRQPCSSLVSPSAVTYLGRPSNIAMPFRWQRSEGSSSVTNRGPPARNKARLGIERGQAGKTRVYNPQLAATAVGHFMNQDVAGDVAGTGQIAGVVRSLRLQPGRHVGDVAIFPDLDGGSDGQPGAAIGKGQPHRCLEGAKMRVDGAGLLADQHQLSRLIGGHHQRNASLSQQSRQIRGVGRQQRPGVFGA